MTNEAAIRILKHELYKALEQQVTKDTNVTNNDCISRQAAIDALIKADYEFTGILSEPRARRFEQTINALPSAQPDLSEYSDKLWRSAYERGKAEAQAEIVRCKDCKHFIKDHGWNRIEYTVCSISPIHKVIRQPDDFCSRSERRTDD